MMKRFLCLLFLGIAMLGGMSLTSCQHKVGRPQGTGPRPGEGGHRLFLYYAAGKNSLASFIRDDIQELAGNYLPMDRDVDNVVLMYCRLSNSKEARPSYLVRLFRDADDQPVLDTLQTYAPEINAADPQTLNMVLNEVQERFPDRKYGMLFSSHATGWLPQGYYGNESGYERREFSRKVPQRSIGQDANKGESVEIDLKDFAEAIPMHMDYIVFDACLMGGIEVAWQLRYVCDQVGFSQTEILADGFDYKKIIENLFMTPVNYAERICRDYFEQYESKYGWERSATVSLIKTRNLEGLARICKDLTGKYSGQISQLSRNRVQRYFRFDYDYFYDLKDIYQQAGANAMELSTLQAALDNCILYKAATEEFMLQYSGFAITTYSGLSMYLPSSQKPRLNEYYKTLDWNIAINLVK